MKGLVFAHYDPHGLVDDYVIHALKCYRQYFDVVCVVSSADLADHQVTLIRPLADVVIVRRNVGYDFGSWRVGYEAIHRFGCTELSFANDSCYGPVTDIGVLMTKGAALGTDIWGAAISTQFARHAQSYFVSFRQKAISGGFVDRFWRSIEPVEDKLHLILSYEVGLSTRATADGLTVGGVVELAPVDDATIVRVLADNRPEPGMEHARWASTEERIRTDPDPNPSQLFALESMRRGSPFIKIEVLRDNPLQVGIGRIFAAARASRVYDAGLIERHLQRVAPSAALLKDLHATNTSPPLFAKSAS